MASTAKHFSLSGSFGKRPLYVPSLAELITGDFDRLKSSGHLNNYNVLEPTPAKKYISGQLGKISGAAAKALGTSVTDYTGSPAPSPDTIISSSGLGSSASSPAGISSGAGSSDYLGNGQSVNYLNADLAKHYGMDASTAYQEALTNTGYQRSVKDMQAAGLNPAVLFGAGSVNPASGVGYVSPINNGSGSGYSVGTSSAQSSHKYYKLLSNVGTFMPLVTGRMYDAFAGRAVLGAVGNLIDTALGT
jgi:hypothetical protein